MGRVIKKGVAYDTTYCNVSEAEGRTQKENTVIAKKMLEKLLGIVPTLKSLSVKLNHALANQENYDLVLISEFDNLEALQEYIVHPAHKEVSDFIGKVREKRACIDFEI
ncbi:Dabb family protein [Lachnoclostridium sp.]|uniref:Dabb family protein n=1 Tax=Lachnoclostridium sp. TaxID=2028282 RepID=UPI00289A86DA|nr:Dabb family protein [Lachnoclostridium sp.]